MCDTCDGTGYVTTYERHPYGSTYATEALSDPCPDCLYQNVCPCCGQETIAWVHDRHFDCARCTDADCSWRELPEGLRSIEELNAEDPLGDWHGRNE